MKRIIFLLFLSSVLVLAQTPSGDEILKKVDRTMFSENKILTSRMVIHGRRENRTITAKSWQRHTNEAFTEYLAPPREQGTKMLKLQNNLWTYSPSTDRIIMISGHMLRQSVMGSDLSYEDMMEDPHLPNLYSAKATNEETYNKRQCWVLELSAKKEEIAYNRRQIWVDKARFIILKENLYAKGGMLLKTMDIREVMEVQNHWIAKSVLYIKMSSKKGKGQNSSSILLFSIQTYLIISFQKRH
jgi:outer membrane lipoprotein-sorting protein